MKRYQSYLKKVPQKMKCLTFTLPLVVVWMVSAAAEASLINLTGTLRDFQDSHSDMERWIDGHETGLVEKILGADKKPVYTGQSSLTIESASTFDEWYNDVGGVNMSHPLTITLDNMITSDPGVYTFTDQDFFPLDDMAWGNEGREHNYHFTYELHSNFMYQSGQSFSFAGDDDLWVYINNELAIDLGGVHAALGQTVPVG